MSFVCIICSKPYTGTSTEHALYSTKCGHVMGESCLKKWIRENSCQGRFNCPVCRTILICSDCHPIYNLPIESLKSKSDSSKDKYLSEDDILTDYLIGRLEKGSTFFIETGNRRMFRKFIEFFDIHNGYILIAAFYWRGFGDVEYNRGTGSHKFVIQIFEGTNIFYSEDFGSVPFTAVAFNKFREDGIEFCVGFENGSLKSRVFSLANEDFGIPNGGILINEDGQINSICFLDKNKVIYSVGECDGECNIFSVRTDKFCVKENWLGNINVRFKTVTNLTVINDCVLLGIMYGNIYVFEKNKIPYLLYSGGYTQVTNYTYDSVVDMILTVNSSPYGFNDYWENFLKDIRDERIVSHEIRSISKIFKYDNEGCRREVYINYPVGDFPDITSQVIHEFSPTIISTKYCDKYLIYSFIPNAENSMLQVHLVNDALKVVGKNKIDDFDECIGVFALEKPQVLLARVVKIPIVIIFHYGFKTLNFYAVI